MKSIMINEIKFFFCIVDLVSAFDRVPRRMLRWVMIINGLLQLFVILVMSLYDRAITGVRVEFDVKVMIHQGIVLLHFLPLW